MQLSDRARRTLETAVHALLSDERLESQPEIVRLAAVILLAKAPAESSKIRIRYRDLAGWLGCSVSYVGHTVLPALKKALIVTSKPHRGADGRPEAVDLDLTPLREAREAGTSSPLASLTQKNLATLLRLCEAVTCPGWSPRDRPETPAGFMADRRGFRASTDRLTMVLLVLNARSNGRVRLVPGRVAGGFGRVDATVARLLGYEVVDAVAVVDRLVGMGHVEFEGDAEARSRLRVPAVAEARVRLRRRGRPAPEEETAELVEGDTDTCSNCRAGARDEEEPAESLDGAWWTQQGFDDLLGDQGESAFGDQDALPAALSQINEGFTDGSADESSARPHPSHALVADHSENCAGGESCFSGSAVSGCGQLREGACAREDQIAQPEGHQAPAGSSGGPLRGEKRHSRPVSARRGVAGPVFRGPVAVPEDLHQALMPVTWLWSGLGRASTSGWLAQKVREELVRLAGIVGPQSASSALAGRLQRRLDRQGIHPVRDLVGWLLRTGLPQAQGCWSRTCDDGTRMDTGGPCPSCECLIGDRRGLRQAAAAAVAARYPRATPEELRPLYEQELRERFEQQAAYDVGRREQALAERAAWDGAVAEQRAQFAQQKAARAAAPCRQCGKPGACGYCPVCALGDSTRRLVGQAVDLVLALKADFGDAEAFGDLEAQVERDSWKVVQDVGAEAASAPELRAWAQYDRARQLLDQRHGRALRALRFSAVADEEADRVQSMAQIGPWSTEEEVLIVERRVGETRSRVAQTLIKEYLADLAWFRDQTQPRPAVRPWAERLAELVDRPLDADIHQPQLAASGRREAVSVA
ncbi:hypothetical protein [Streptomyces anulatus]|uniref:hypothetical protein n=1 Tax=Streptomyces anulatus TaxID=1892 RepID=UPI001C25D8EF|nr:hypothetical protein [Streptomyces anulatus]